MVDLHPRYREVLRALEGGTKSSQEIQAECKFVDTFHCSSALSILVRSGHIAKGYRLTQKGRDELEAKEPAAKHPKEDGEPARIVLASAAKLIGPEIKPDDLFR